MNLFNICINSSRNALIPIGLLIGALPAQAAMTYNFRSAPISVGTVLNLGGTEVQTVGPFNIGDPQTASLTFESPLAANSNIQISAESGGFDFVGSENQGGLIAYSAFGLPIPITSDINQYLTGAPIGDQLSVYRYSSLEGSVTTNDIGNISTWDLRFTLYDDPIGQEHRFLIDRVTNTIDQTPGFTDAFLAISSNAPTSQTITNVAALNGEAYDQNDHTFTFDGADTVFIDPGTPQYTFYTSQPGVMVTIPEPETWGMMMAGLGLLGWRIRNLKK
jgi:hypothetical protein